MVSQWQLAAMALNAQQRTDRFTRIWWQHSVNCSHDGWWWRA